MQAKNYYLIMTCVTALIMGGCGGGGNSVASEAEKVYIITYVDLDDYNDEMLLMLDLCKIYGAEFRTPVFEGNFFTASMTMTEATSMESDHRVIDVTGSATPTGG